MADINSKLEIGVTTGPIRGSRKIHVAAPGNPKIQVAMRAIDLEPSCGEPPLNVYDTSGPYTDPAVTIDIAAGLPMIRRDWQLARGDVEEYAPRTTASWGRTDRVGFLPSPPPCAARCAPSRERTSARCIMRSKASSPPRWNTSLVAKTSGVRC